MTEREATILSLVDQLTVERRSCADKVRALAVEHTRLGAALAAAVTLADHLNIALPPDVFEADAPALPDIEQDDPGAASPEIPAGPREDGAAVVPPAAPAEPEAVPVPPAAQSAEAIVPPWWNGPKTGPYSPDFLEACRVVFERDGGTVKALAEAVGVAYGPFTTSFRRYRDRVRKEKAKPAKKGKPAKAALPPTPVPVPGDPDPKRGGSPWTIERDIDLLEDVAMGMAGAKLAELYNCTLLQVKARIQLLHPTNDPMQIGKVIQQLKTLKEGAPA